MSNWTSPAIASQFYQFLEAYRLELSKKSRAPSSQSTSQWPEAGAGQVPDPTTANALSTSTVVLRKKSSNRRNSPFDGVPLSNYWIRHQDVRAEVYDWISHFLSLKNCPLELSTVVANRISSKMSEQLLKSSELNNPELFEDKSAALCSVDSSPLVDLCSLDTVDHTPRSSLPAALSSVDVARQSRKLVDEYLEELGANPDNVMAAVSELMDSAPTNGNSDAPTSFTTSIYAVKNRRTTMEDRHIIIQNLNKTLDIELPKQYSYYAVFDGHAGVDAASFSTAHLHYYLVESPAFREGRIEDAFREAFEKTDQLYIKRYKEDGVDKLKPSGTTALCALIEDNRTVYLAWAGDSQAVLVRNGCHEEIMLPHKPDLDSERARIQDLGGLIIYMDTWRVNGVLSVTRAIGDPEHKPLIISEPALAKFEIDPSLDFLVLGCDGLFDQLTSQDITSHVFEYLCKNEARDPQEVMQGVSAYLSQMAICEGSNDNITTIVIFFKPFEQLVATGYPAKEQAQDGLLHQGADPNLNSTTLQTTNGGHFPYTDFSQLPPGTLFKLTDEFKDDNHNHEITNPFDISSDANVEQSFVMIESEPKTQTINPFDNNELADDILSDEQCDDEFDFVPTPAGEFALTQSNQVDLVSQLTEKSTVAFDQEAQLMAMEANESNVSHSLVESQEQPFTETIDVNVENKTENMFAEDFSREVVDTTPQVNFDESNSENTPFVEETFVTVSSTSPAKAEQTDNVTNQMNDLLGLNDVEFQAPVEPPLEEISHDGHEVSHQNETAPEIVQHPSDSGYCYTNSISEFSTSFPSQQKLEDNFCSTPVVEQPSLSQSDNESGLANQGSTILSATSDTTDPDSIQVQPNAENGELIENTLKMTPEIQNEEVVSNNLSEQVKKEEFDVDIFASPLANHIEVGENKMVAFESPPQGMAGMVPEESPQVVPQVESEVTAPVEVSDLIKEDLHNKVNDLDKKVEDLDNKGEDLDKKVEGFDSKVEDFDKKVEELDNKGEDLDKKVEDFDSKVEDSDSKVEDSGNKVENLDNKVEELGNKVNESLLASEMEGVQNENAHILPPQSEGTQLEPLPLSTTQSEAKIEMQETKTESLKPKAGQTLTSNVKKTVASTISKTKSPMASTKVASKPATTVTSRNITKPSGRPTTTTAATSRLASTTSKVNGTSTGVAKETLAKKTVAPRVSTMSRPSGTSSRPGGLTTRTGTTTRPTLTTTRPTSTTTKPSVSAATTRPVTTTLRSTAPRPAPKTTSSTAKPMTSRIGSSASTSQLKPSPKATSEVKPTTTRRSLASTSKIEPRKPTPAVSKISTTRPTTSVASKVGSLRPPATSAASKVATSKPGVKPVPAKPANGTIGMKAVPKKPVGSLATQSKASEASKPTVPNGVVKPASTLKRNNMIGVENSLKQELEDAAMNEMNALNPPSFNEVNGLAQ